MRVWHHSKIDRNGQEYIGIEIEKYDLNLPIGPTGGMYVSFEVNHKKQQTSAHWMHSEGGSPQVGGHIRTWKEILTEEECLKYCEEEYGNDSKRQS